MRNLTVHYRRLPDRVARYVQRFVHQDENVIVSLLPHASKAIRIGGVTVVEEGAPIIWFTFPGRRYDVARFYLRDGKFTGYYSDIIAPDSELRGDEIRVTDLFLDVWMDARGRAALLDEDELQRAVEGGWVSPEDATDARAEAQRIMDEAAAGRWPEEVVRHWTLEKVYSFLE